MTTIPPYRPSPSGGWKLRELRTDVLSWRLLLSYLDAAAVLDLPLAGPSTRPAATELVRLAAAAQEASESGLPGRRKVRVAVILNEAKHWLTDSTQASHLRDAGIELLDNAAAYARVLSGAVAPAVFDLLDPTLLALARHRWRRRHPVRTHRQPDLPRVLDPMSWQASLWYVQHVDHAEDPREPARAYAPWGHAAAAIAAAVWTWPKAVGDPDHVRQELRDRIDRAQAWIARPPVS